MKKILNIIMITIALLSMFNCSKVEAGHVGIKVNLLGGDKGVDSEVLGVGRYWIGVNEDLYIFPTFTQNYVWTADEREGSPENEELTFQTAEGMSASVDMGISYRLEVSKIPQIFQKYRKGINEITDLYVRNIVRDALNSTASKYKVESVYGAGKSELLVEVEKSVKSQLDSMGIIVDKLYWVGSIRLPANVLAALNAKVGATQRAEQRENELREAEAQAKKTIAEANGTAQAQLVKAQAEAESNRIISQSLSTNIIEYEKIKKWNGQLPQVSGSNGSIVDLRVK